MRGMALDPEKKAKAIRVFDLIFAKAVPHANHDRIARARAKRPHLTRSKFDASGTGR